MCFFFISKGYIAQLEFLAPSKTRDSGTKMEKNSLQLQLSVKISLVRRSIKDHPQYEFDWGFVSHELINKKVRIVKAKLFRIG